MWLISAEEPSLYLGGMSGVELRHLQGGLKGTRRNTSTLGSTEDLGLKPAPTIIFSPRQDQKTELPGNIRVVHGLEGHPERQTPRKLSGWDLDIIFM